MRRASSRARQHPQVTAVCKPPDPVPGPPSHRGVCTADGTGAAALVQHADFGELCRTNPPYGFRSLCRTDADLLRRLPDPAQCRYRSCAVVGSSGNLLGARLGASIDSHDAVIRINLAPDGTTAAGVPTAPHGHGPTWTADIGARTTFRVLTMEDYACASTADRTRDTHSLARMCRFD